MSTIRMFGSTGNDDLRSDCHALLRVFLKGNPNPLVFDPILGGQHSGDPFDETRDIGPVNNPNDINSFQIEHVSVEHGLETPDNWDMARVDFQFNAPHGFPQIIAHSDFHRFTGDSRVLDLPVVPPG